ncbi:hypothetical protein [Victivallis sp. Marseille-Q1083]|uniref:hypothetical protein n=1 Tax=Victivallis sp. Marseille-Q1083 TaxID=2717288 RepID=UPI00158BF053|nr:hypothetical protein [Victivallis sp. Marseille-Q1083]
MKHLLKQLPDTAATVIPPLARRNACGGELDGAAPPMTVFNISAVFRPVYK